MMTHAIWLLGTCGAALWTLGAARGVGWAMWAGGIVAVLAALWLMVRGEDVTSVARRWWR